MIREFIKESENEIRVREKLANLSILCLYITVGDTGKDTKRTSCQIFSILRLYFYFSKVLLDFNYLALYFCKIFQQQQLAVSQKKTEEKRKCCYDSVKKMVMNPRSL